jgi:hypothetical protein
MSKRKALRPPSKSDWVLSGTMEALRLVNLDFLAMSGVPGEPTRHLRRTSKSKHRLNLTLSMPEGGVRRGVISDDRTRISFGESEGQVHDILRYDQTGLK